MITLYCHPVYQHFCTAPSSPLYERLLCNPSPLSVLPLLAEEDLLRSPACGQVLRQLSRDALRQEADPCYLVNRQGRRRLLFCLPAGWQAALAVAAVAALPEYDKLSARLREKLSRGSEMPGSRSFCLEMTPELCDARIWRALNSLDLPVELATDPLLADQLRRRLERTPPEDGREAPYRLVLAKARRELTVLTHQDTAGWDSDPLQVAPEEDGCGQLLLTSGDGFDLIASRWQDPGSWYRWDLSTTLSWLPVPRTAPAFSGLSDRYTVRDEMTDETSLELLAEERDLTLMTLERDQDGHWRADERLLEGCDSYYDLFDAALEGAGAPARWVLAVDLDRPPLCLQELARCEVLFSFYLYRDTVTLTNGLEALRRFLSVLEAYGSGYRGPHPGAPVPSREE